MTNTKKFIPPDGGWGWMVVLACGLNNMVMVPLIIGMGLIFENVFKKLHFSPTEITIITSTNMSFGMAMGLLHGPLLRMFGYRKVGFTGGTLFATGILLTAFSTKFLHFMVCYGLMTSMGVGLSMSSFSLAVNTYFLKKRGRAMGLAMTLTGIGPIIMPQIITLLLRNYSSQGTILVLGAITLHTIVAALLLQPVKWHMKQTVNELSDNEEVGNVENPQPDAVISDSCEKKPTIRLSSLNNDMANKDFQALKLIEETKSNKILLVRRNLGKSSQSINLGSSLMLFDEPIVYGSMPILLSDKNIEEKKPLKDKQEIPDEPDIEKQIVSNGTHNETIKKLPKSKGCYNFVRNIVEFFDLSLLCDPIYVNIMLGISIATFAEMTFIMLVIYMLGEIKLTESQIAISMSTMATVDLIMRGFSPFIGEWLRQTPRILYLVSLAILIASRTILIFCTSFIPVIIMAVGIGFAKGFRSVFTALIVPSHVPIERLADATGIQTVVNGIILMLFGPLIGIMREARGNYGPCIVILNAMSTLTIIMWTSEMIILKRLARKKIDEHKYIVVAQ